MKQYRVPLFLTLAERMKSHGVTLQVAYGDPPAQQRQRKDNVDLPGKTGFKVRNFWFADDRMLIQDVIGLAWQADLVVVEQSNLMLTNHLLLLLSALRGRKIAFWGHGRNLQARRASLGESFKRWMVNKVDWWFAYTDGTAAYLTKHGMPAERVTVVQNAVDTETFRNEIENIEADEVSAERTNLGIAARDIVALYCGSLHADKELAFLVAAVEQARKKLPGLVLLVVGGGPLQDWVESQANGRSWLRYLGPAFGRERAKYFKMSTVFLNPGLVGLGVLDAFCAGLPILTTRYPYHSPEIEYVRHERGILTALSQDPGNDTVRSEADRV